MNRATFLHVSRLREQQYCRDPSMNDAIHFSVCEAATILIVAGMVVLGAGYGFGMLLWKLYRAMGWVRND